MLEGGALRARGGRRGFGRPSLDPVAATLAAAALVAVFALRLSLFAVLGGAAAAGMLAYAAGLTT